MFSWVSLHFIAHIFIKKLHFLKPFVKIHEKIFFYYLQYLASRKYSITELLEELIRKYLSDELFERKRIHAEETAEHSK